MGYLEKLYDRNFLEYASYVIKDRAIPNIEDGLKPVQRRILHTLFEMHDGKFHKVANVTGACMKYHPHGDASIYSALVVLANKDLFIDKQGNFGNIYTGDLPSAARYIECRLLPLAHEVLYNPELTAFEDSYDGRNQEPLSFPAKIPVVLVQGAEGIAVGMATKILPHNLIEVMEAQIACLQDKKIKLYPDFPTGGQLDASEYNDGNGTVRSRAKLETTKDGKRIIIREIPFGTSTGGLIDSIESAAKKNKLKVSSINDYTAEKVEIEIKLPREVYAKDVEDALYAFTECEIPISANLIVIRDNRPVQMSVTEVVGYCTDLLVNVLKGELKIEESKLHDRLHAITLEQLFIEKRIYKAIEKMKTQEGIYKAVENGLKKYKILIKRDVTREDIERLLRIPIRRISLYDINRSKAEMGDIKTRLKAIAKSLKDLKGHAIGFLQGLIKKYREQFPRRTKIVSFGKVDVREVARRDLKLRYDKKTGYLGYEVSGDALFDVSSFDRVLVIRGTGTWSVINVADRVFVDRGMFYCGFINKDIIFNMVYRDNKTGYPYIKRCTIEKFILNKGYPLVPDNCKVMELTTDPHQLIEVEYKPKPRVRILHETFKIEDYPIRGNKAKGIRLANRELKGVKFTRIGEGKEGKGGQTRLF